LQYYYYLLLKITAEDISSSDSLNQHSFEKIVEKDIMKIAKLSCWPNCRHLVRIRCPALELKEKQFFVCFQEKDGIGRMEKE
jgi:hypothetical protein